MDLERENHQGGKGPTTLSLGKTNKHTCTDMKNAVKHLFLFGQGLVSSQASSSSEEAPWSSSVKSRKHFLHRDSVGLE